VVLTAGLALAGLSEASAETLRVLTYNVWHGFWRTPAKELLLLPSESPSDQTLRASLQSDRLARLAPDILMGQEVHPLPWRARELAKAMSHDSIHQLVSCGLRFLNVGVPWAIRSGLAITATEGFELTRVAAPKLSGRLGYCNDWLGLQLEEARRALLGRIVLEDGRRLLLVTTHLHSSTEGGPAREDRRVSEVAALLDAIAAARRDDPRLAGVILGGDLNALDDSESIARLRAAGYVDVAQAAGSEFATYDPWSNPLAARMTKAGGGDPARSAPRRIDYLFVSRELVSAVRSVEPYGVEPEGSPEGTFDSDHFGVVLELSF
jgi:endonuclease/exonuclease/phosphatase family metal-dependent hydrolase